jgi:hypothetical protein
LACAAKTTADIRQLKKTIREEEMSVVNSQNELAKQQVQNTIKFSMPIEQGMQMFNCGRATKQPRVLCG